MSQKELDDEFPKFYVEEGCGLDGSKYFHAVKEDKDGTKETIALRKDRFDAEMCIKYENEYPDLVAYFNPRSERYYLK